MRSATEGGGVGGTRCGGVGTCGSFLCILARRTKRVKGGRWNGMVGDAHSARSIFEVHSPHGSPATRGSGAEVGGGRIVRANRGGVCCQHLVDVWLCAILRVANLPYRSRAWLLVSGHA